MKKKAQDKLAAKANPVAVSEPVAESAVSEVPAEDVAAEVSSVTEEVPAQAENTEVSSVTEETPSA